MNTLSTINNPLGGTAWRLASGGHEDSPAHRERPPWPHGVAECFW